LHGDRQFGDDASLVGGIAKLEGMPVMIIGHEKAEILKKKLRETLECLSQRVTGKLKD